MRVRSNSPDPVAPRGTDRPTQRSEGRQARLDRNGQRPIGLLIVNNTDLTLLPFSPAGIERWAGAG